MSIAPLPVETRLRPDNGGFRYEIERLLGTGGFGHTYLARDRNLNRLVAIKELAFAAYCYRDTQRFVVVVHGGREERFRRLKEKFVQEAQKVAAIQEASDHRNIIRVHDVWEERGTAYYSMDYIRASGVFGEAPVRDARGGLDWPTVERLARQLLSGIAAVHDNGMFHGDLKPDNLLVTESGTIKILDFGTARREEDLANPVTSLAYSLGYAPVELMNPARIHEIGPWSDIYSIGMILIGATLGHPSDDGMPVDPVVRQRSSEGDPYGSIHPRLLEAGVPEPWSEAIATMIAIEPKDRFESVQQLLAAVSTEQQSSPAAAGRSRTVMEDVSATALPLAHGPSVPERLATGSDDTRSGGRNRAVIGLIGVLALITAGLAIALLQPWNKDDPKPADTPDALANAQDPDAQSVDFADASSQTNQDGRSSEDSAPTTTIAEATSPCEGPECEPEDPCAGTACVPEGFVPFGGGQVTIGRADDGAAFDESDERPVSVLIAPFALAVHEVTNAEWQEVFGETPSFFSGCDDCPVESVNWYEALAYLNRRSQAEGYDECYVLDSCHGTIGGGCGGAGACRGDYHCDSVRWIEDCDGYRLPTEQEWEYAARFHDGAFREPCDRDECLPPEGWYSENSERRTHPVGTSTIRRDEDGLRDMFGNVCEWVWNPYEDPLSPRVDPVVMDHTAPVSRRGGGFTDEAVHLRATNRMYNDRRARSGHTGFRAATNKRFEPAKPR